MASVPSSPSMNAMVDTITNAVESTLANRSIAGPPRFVIQSAVRRALRDIDAGRAPVHRFNGVRTVAGARRSSPRRYEFAPGVCPEHGATIFARRLGGDSPPPMPIRPMPNRPMPSPNAFTLPKPPTSLMPSSSVPAAVAAHWNGSAAGARAWPPGFAYDINAVLPRASSAASSLRSYADVAAAAPRPIGSGRPSSSVEGEDAPRH